jgi:hypothetical protein
VDNVAQIWSEISALVAQFSNEINNDGGAQRYWSAPINAVNIHELLSRTYKK